jgi:transposase
MVFEHAPEYPSQWGVVRSVAETIGGPVEVLRRWVRQAELDTGHRPGLATDTLNNVTRAVFAA